MAKATAKHSILVAKYFGLHASPSVQGIEGAAQSWKKGALLKAAGGKIVIATESDATLLLGIALGDASGVTDKKANFCPALPHVVFQGELSDLTDGAYTLVQTDLYGDFGLNVAGDGKWFVDADEAAAEQVVTIMGFKDPVGTNNAIVYFSFKQSTTIFN